MDSSVFNKKFVLKEIFKIIIFMIFTLFTVNAFSYIAYKNDRLIFAWLPIIFNIPFIFIYIKILFDIVKKEKNRVSLYNKYVNMYNSIIYDPEIRKIKENKNFQTSLDIAIYLKNIDNKFGNEFEFEQNKDKYQRIINILDSYFEEKTLKDKIEYYSKSSI